jgi:hypothetical protein
MPAMKVLHYKDPPTLLIGLGELRRTGLTPRGLLFLAIEHSGTIHVAVPEDIDLGVQVKVGEKLGLAFPLEGRYFHYDSVHRLRDGCFLINGDRRLPHPGNYIEVAGLVSEFLKGAGAKNVFFGCTPHQPGSWLRVDGSSIALHEAGFVEAVPVRGGLIARRIMDHQLWQLETSKKLDDWQPVFASPLGNVVMLERRIINDRLVLTCERGLVEVDVGRLPEVKEIDRVAMKIGFAVVGRVENAAFAVTQGKPEPWGLDGIRPAVLIGAQGGSLQALGAALAEAAKPRE